VLIDAEDVESILADFERRIAEITAIGGVSLFDVVQGRKRKPDGWVLDVATDFYVPPWWTWEPDREPS